MNGQTFTSPLVTCLLSTKLLTCVARVVCICEYLFAWSLSPLKASLRYTVYTMQFTPCWRQSSMTLSVNVYSCAAAHPPTCCLNTHPLLPPARSSQLPAASDHAPASVASAWPFPASLLGRYHHTWSLLGLFLCFFISLFALFLLASFFIVVVLFWILRGLEIQSWIKYKLQRALSKWEK